jgi:hypothetical protein
MQKSRKRYRGKTSNIPRRGTKIQKISNRSVIPELQSEITYNPERNNEISDPNNEDFEEEKSESYSFKHKISKTIRKKHKEDIEKQVSNNEVLKEIKDFKQELLNRFDTFNGYMSKIVTFLESG